MTEVDFTAADMSRTPAEERRITHSYYLGMALQSCLDKHRLLFLAEHGYDVETKLRDLLSFIDNEVAALVVGSADLFDFVGVWHVRHADGSIEDIELTHGNLVENNVGTCGQFLLRQVVR